MAELIAAAAAFQAFVDVASTVQTAGENYYKATAEWNDFPLKMDRLRGQGEVWLAAFTKYGISDKVLVEALQQATSLLTIEQGLLADRKKLEGTIYGRLTVCCAKAHVLVFPSEISLRISRVEEAFAHISVSLKLKEEADNAGWRELLNRTPSLAFRVDERYVPLEETERQIYFAIEDSSGSTVVLLYGGPGTGKSSLARNVALHYKLATKEDGQVANSALFEEVVFLECGPHAETSAKQQRLLQQLGLKSSFVDQELTLDFSQLLKGALKSREIFIIFDDVWDDKFLQDMINVCGENVKCLVTSRDSNLCSGLNFSSIHEIEIQSISQEVGRKILASYVRFPNQQIKDEKILAVVDDMVAATEGNPLALASVVSAIQESKKNSSNTWEEAYADLKLSLGQDSRQQLHGQKYPGSFWAATKLSIQSVQAEAQSLLVLVHLCRGPSVPEEVIRYLAGKINLLGRKVTFQKLSADLEGRQLVKINGTLGADSHMSMMSWSTHSLQNLFMHENEKMQEQTEKIFGQLVECDNIVDMNPNVESEIRLESVGEEEDFKVTKVLCELYFEDRFAKKMPSQVTGGTDKLKVQQRQALEPITRLVGRPLNRTWTSAAHKAAKQVFVMYICNCEFENEKISSLLELTTFPPAQLAILSAIADIHLIEGAPLLTEDSTIVTSVVTCLQNSKTPFLQEKAAEAIWALGAAGESNSLKILRTEGAKEALMVAMNNNYSRNLTLVAGQALSVLSYYSAKLPILEDKGPLAGMEGAVTEIITARALDGNPVWQEAAPWALQNLADGGADSFMHTMLQDAEIQNRLLHFLSSDDDADVETGVGAALLALAYGESSKLQIINQEGVFAGLVRALAMDENPMLQLRAAEVLRILADGESSLKDRILQEDGVLNGLVHSLSSGDNAALQDRAAAALVNLSAGAESSKLQIVHHEGALAGLVKALAMDRNPGLQCLAAVALQNLAGGDNSLKDRVLQEDGVLNGLVHCLSSVRNSTLQEAAAAALANLVDGEVSGQLQVLNHEGSVAMLVWCLSKKDSPDLQGEVARVLAILANGPKSSKLKILEGEGVLEGLVKSASQADNPALQEHARRALQNLTAGGEEIRLHLLGGNEEFASLVNSVFEEYTH